jgi:OmpA-OmpF porin, OOP family
MKVSFFLILFLVNQTLIAQNLVRNSSFEELNNVPKNWIDTKKEFDKTIKYWSSPTNGTPDIIPNSVASSFSEMRGMDFKAYLAHSGRISMGVRIYGNCFTEDVQYMACREYIQIPLVKPTVKGTAYNFEIWVRPIKSSIKCNNLSMAFAKTRVYVRTRAAFSDSIQIAYTIKEIMKGDEWIKFSGTGIADDVYTHLVVGNFREDEESLAEPQTGYLHCGYYLIDDISVTAVNTLPQKGETITLENIQFETNKATLLPVSLPTLDSLFSQLQANQKVAIEINGHTDNIGAKELNQSLSQKRAESVMQYLITKGIDKNRLKSNGFGDSQPLLPNTTEENRAQNRRVEIKVLSD